jgi:hypothetical protein
MSPPKKHPGADAGQRGDYEVGYGRPPVATRFQPGNLRNPRGRPKPKKTAGQLIEEALNAKVKINAEGKTKTMTMQQVIIRTLINAAARGDNKAINTLFGLKAKYQDSTEKTLDPTDLEASDRRIIEGFLASASSNGPMPESSSAADQHGTSSADETNNDAVTNSEGGTDA